MALKHSSSSSIRSNKSGNWKLYTGMELPLEGVGVISLCDRTGDAAVIEMLGSELRGLLGIEIGEESDDGETAVSRSSSCCASGRLSKRYDLEFQRWISCAVRINRIEMCTYIFEPFVIAKILSEYLFNMILPTFKISSSSSSSL